MSHSLYNPFMPSRYLNPRASGLIVFGGGAEEGYAETVPRRTEIAGEPHKLAYINPEEEKMLNDAGSAGIPGPGGVPAYPITKITEQDGTVIFDINDLSPTGPSRGLDAREIQAIRAKAQAAGGFDYSVDANQQYINPMSSDYFYDFLEKDIAQTKFDTEELTKSQLAESELSKVQSAKESSNIATNAFGGIQPKEILEAATGLKGDKTSAEVIAKYDYNKDGRVTPTDALALEKYIEETAADTTSTANTGVADTTSTASTGAAASSGNTTTGNENTMAEEKLSTTELKNLNSRLTTKKDLLVSLQQSLSEEQKKLVDLEARNATEPSTAIQNEITKIKETITAKQTNVNNTQNEVNTLAGELGVKSQGAATEKAVLAAADPAALVESATVAKIDSETAGTKLSDTTGQVTGDIKATRTDAATPVIAAADTVTAETVTTDLTATKSKEEADKVKAVKGTVSDDAKVDAAQGKVSDDSLAKGVDFDKERIDEVTSGERTVTSEELATAQGLDEEAVKANIAEANVPDNIKAAQTKVLPNEIPKPAQIKEADMATAVAVTEEGLTADATATAAKLAKFTVDAETLVEFKEGKIEAEDTVQGQLASLMLDFNDGTPAWAAGAMRAARGAMAARGLGSSSMAMSAIVQASMESAIPIATADANAFREMKLNNLGRQQQVALSNAAAQQGVEIANFNAEQQTALQNSQNSFALQSQNLSNKQAVVLANAQIKASLQGQNLSNQQQSNIAEAARYAEVSNLNLNNRQQGILQDNANEMQVNLANLSAKQQAYIANAQLEAALQGKKIDNKQQVSIENAARFAEANNLTFTAKEQAKIHNSELMKTIGLAELNSKQAATLQNAATIASMDLANLNNRQQAAVQNARAFLEMDITNLNNEQQVVLFKAEAIQQALLTDAAATNATKQFNATSENQTNQFMATLAANIATSNATLANSTNQFNAGEKNATSQFNATIKNQREQFNQEQALVIAQANATWKQNCVTLDTAAQNDANSQTALAVNTFTQAVIDQIWQRERDLMDFAYKGAESSKDRVLDLVLADKKYEEYAKARADQEQTDMWSTLTTLAVGYMKYG